MELKSMKHTPAEGEDQRKAFVDPDPPAYPYGLELHLDNETLDKLELAGLPAVGETLTLMARVKVSAAGEHESEHSDGKQRSLSLQITDMALAPERDERSQAERMFGG